MTGQLTLGGFAPPLNQALSQYHTPVKLARRMVEWAGIRQGDNAIEPSAGGGNIVRELNAQGAHTSAVEIDPKWVEAMRTDQNVHAVCCDFLDMSPPSVDPFHIAIMNPPLDGGVGGDHVLHALKFAPRVISILRGQDLHGQHRWAALWSQCELARIAFLVHRPKYSGSGGQIETVVVDVYRHGTHSGPQSIEHWAESWH